ncbi:MAG: precorrin-6Y C5,15-methyltransferase (decarboxylating) subunit CbiT [Clostridia bacterium]|nr:precorrin-6Y C5,15-methyltransferase (decarboxylating) subunit CbiT [Clostridia bacterium]
MEIHGQEVVIVGCGLGTPATLTVEAAEAVRSADRLIGPARLLAALALPGVQQSERTSGPDVVAEVHAHPDERIAILFPGDPGFFSSARTLARELGSSVRILPGVSAFSALCDRLRIPEEEVRFLRADASALEDIVYAVSRNPWSCIQTGQRSSTHAVLTALMEAGLGALRASCGYALGQSDELLAEDTVDGLAQSDLPETAALLLSNPDWARYTVIGLPDEAFFRGTVPMTKFEVRNIAASKLEIAANDTVYDIGGGTGAVSIELSRRAYLGKVYAVERLPEALYLLNKNRRHLRAFNMEIVAGEAPEALKDLPAPDKVFIGGSGGRIGQIIEAVHSANPQVTIVATAATLETLSEARNAFEQHGCRTEVLQVNASRLVSRGNAFTMFQAINPVFVMIARSPQ